jgi:hypothetical protein
VVLRYYFSSCGESCLLVSWCVGDMCDKTSNDEDRDRSRKPGAVDWGWSNTVQVLSGRVIKRSGDTVCGLHHTHGYDEREFLG